MRFRAKAGASSDAPRYRAVKGFNIGADRFEPGGEVDGLSDDLVQQLLTMQVIEVVAEKVKEVEEWPQNED